MHELPADPALLLSFAQRQLAAASAILFDRRADARDCCEHLSRAWAGLARAWSPQTHTTQAQLGELAGWADTTFWHRARNTSRTRRREVLAQVLAHGQTTDPTADQPSCPPDRLLEEQCRLLEQALKKLQRHLLQTGRLPSQRKRWVVAAALAIVALVLGLVLLLRARQPVEKSAFTHPEQKAAALTRQLSEGSARAPGAWLGRYYANPAFSGPPSSRQEDAVAFSWQRKGPFEGFPADHFSVRWDTCLFASDTTAALFELGCDDGCRLWLDGKQLIDLWGVHPIQYGRSALEISPGNHHLHIEFFEQTNKAAITLKTAFQPAKVALSSPVDVTGENPCERAP